MVAGLWLLLAAVSAEGQTMTTTVTAGTDPHAVAVNPVTNKIYVVNFSSGNVTVIDGASNTPTTVTDPNAINPVAVAVNPVTNKIYVANNGSGNVTVIDGATNSTTTVSAGSSPVAVAVNPVTNQIYVANSDSNNITVIAGATNTPTTVTDPNAISPIALALNPVTNKIYVANSGSSNVTVINGATNSISTVSAGTNPQAVAVNPVSNKIYVASLGTAASAGSGNVTVIDGATNSTTTVSTQGSPNRVAVNPVTNEIYVANGSNVVVIAGSTNAITQVTVGATPDAVAVNPLTNEIYVANNESSNVTVIAGATNSTATVTDPNANAPVAVAVNPVTDKIYVADSLSDNVTVIDGATNSIATVGAGTTPQAVAVNPVTNAVYVADSGSNGVTVINGATNGATPVNVGTSPQAVAVNPFTNQIYVANNGSNNVTVIDGATNSPTTVTDPNALGPVAVAVNPVTDKIYVANTGSNNVTVIDGNTNSTTTVTDPNALGPAAVAVDPVTNKIYVANNASNNLTVIDGATNSTTTVTDANALGPIAVAVNEVTNKIYVANKGSGNVTVIDGATNSTTTVSAGSAPMAVAVNPVSNIIYVANASSDNVTAITGATNSTATVSAGITPSAVAVNFVTNKIYVANSGDSNDVTVIDGATNTPTSVRNNNGLAPLALAVNRVTNTIYVANTKSSNVTVITEQQVQAIPIQSSITSLADNQTESVTPAFSFTATNTFTTAAIEDLLFRSDTWQVPWLAATSQGGGSFTGTTSSLQPGFHILYAYSTEGEEATSTNTGQQGSSLIGNITAYGFLVAAPEAAFTPGSRQFASQPVGTASAAQSVILTNSGGAPLTVSAVAISGSNSSDFSESDNCVSSSPIASAGTCTLNLTFTPTAVGARTATLVVTDNSGYVNGNQHALNLTGTAVQATTTTVVTSSANPSGIGLSVTFTATVTPQGLGTPTGVVTFLDGTTTLCGKVALSSGKATCTPASLALGTHSITAVYSGDPNFLGSTSLVLTQTVLPAPTLISISPGTGAVGAAVNVTLTGINFAAGAAVNVNNISVGVSNVDVVSSTLITATFTIAGGAAYGATLVTVTTVGGASGPVAYTIVPPLNLTGFSATSVPTQPASIGIALSSPATAQLTGTLALSFTPDPKVTNVPSGYSDPGLQFAAGGTTMNFTIPAGATTITLAQNGAIQQGTVAGTITATVTQLSEGELNLLPQPPPSASIIVPLLAPVITSGSVKIVNITSTGFAVELDAYSTPRDLQSATFNFQASSGTRLSGPTSFSVSLSSIAPAWFASASGLQNGGDFQLVVPFTFSGNTSVFGPNSVTVTLSDSVGTSSPVSGGP